MKRKAITWILAGTILVSTVLAGCGSNSGSSGQEDKTESTAASGKNAEETITVKWLTQGPGENDWEGVTRPMLETFEEETGIHVDAEFVTWNDFFDFAEVELSSGKSDYDVISVDISMVARYSDRGYLAPLDDYFTEEETAQWDEASRESAHWEGTMYTAPAFTSSEALFYNKTLLDEAGITLSENDADNRLTYEEVTAMAEEGLKKLDPDGSRGLIGFDFEQGATAYQMNIFANAMGGKNINDTGDSLRGAIDTEPWKKAMTWYQDLTERGIASKGYSYTEIRELFGTGKILFLLGTTPTMSYVTNNDEIGATYVPCFEGYEDQAATPTGGWHFGISANSKNKEAAAELVKFFTLGKGNEMWVEAENRLPCLLSLQDKLSNSADTPDYYKVAIYESANSAVPRARTPQFGEYTTIVDRMWEDVRNGADIDDCINSAIQQFDSSIASAQ